MVLLAEVARLAPPGQIGGVTGGVLAFTSIAMMIYPALYGVILVQFLWHWIPICSAINCLVIFLRKPIE